MRAWARRPGDEVERAAPFQMGTCNQDTSEVSKTTAILPVTARLRPFRSDETLSRSSHLNFLEPSFT